MPSNKIRRTYNVRGKAHVLQAVLMSSLTRAGLLVKQAAQDKAPELTGTMTRSIGVTRPTVSKGALVVRIGPSVEYAKYTEEQPYISGKQLGPISQAKGATMPWLKPALEENQKEVVEILQGGVRQGLARIAAGARRLT